MLQDNLNLSQLLHFKDTRRYLTIEMSYTSLTFYSLHALYSTESTDAHIEGRHACL